MATKKEIIQKIEKYIRYNSYAWDVFGYSVWTIGITDNPKRRKREHKHPKKFKAWHCNTVAVARAIEIYFIEKGMAGGGGGGKHPDWVYVF